MTRAEAEVEIDQTDGELTFEEQVEEWTEFLPQILNAIDNGYLDSYLKDIGRAARDRYFEVNPDKRRVPDVQRTPAPSESNFDPLAHQYLGEDVFITPTHRNWGSGGVQPPSTHIEMFGNLYLKREFLHQLFRLKNFSKVPNDSVAQIVKVNRTTFEIKIVWCPPSSDPHLVDLANRALGTHWRFKHHTCSRFFAR